MELPSLYLHSLHLHPSTFHKPSANSVGKWGDTLTRKESLKLPSIENKIPGTSKHVSPDKLLGRVKALNSHYQARSLSRPPKANENVRRVTLMMEKKYQQWQRRVENRSCQKECPEEVFEDIP